MKDSEIYNIFTEFINNENYKNYFKSNEDQWKINLDFVKKYIDINNKRPSKLKDNEGYCLGRWISANIQNYKKCDKIMKDESIKKLWEDFINDEKYKRYF